LRDFLSFEAPRVPAVARVMSLGVISYPLATCTPSPLSSPATCTVAYLEPYGLLVLRLGGFPSRSIPFLHQTRKISVAQIQEPRQRNQGSEPRGSLSRSEPCDACSYLRKSQEIAACRNKAPVKSLCSNHFSLFPLLKHFLSRGIAWHFWRDDASQAAT
jgi:hypothetical protein